MPKPVLETYLLQHDGKPVHCPSSRANMALRRYLSQLVRDAAEASRMRLANPRIPADQLPDAAYRATQVLEILEERYIIDIEDPDLPDEQRERYLHPVHLHSILTLCVETYRAVFAPWLAKHHINTTPVVAAESICRDLLAGLTAGQHIFPHPSRPEDPNVPRVAGSIRYAQRPFRHAVPLGTPGASLAQVFEHAERTQGPLRQRVQPSYYVCTNEDIPDAALFVWIARLDLTFADLSRLTVIRRVLAHGSGTAFGGDDGRAVAWLAANTLAGEFAGKPTVRNAIALDVKLDRRLNPGQAAWISRNEHVDARHMRPDEVALERDMRVKQPKRPDPALRLPDPKRPPTKAGLRRQERIRLAYERSLLE